MGRFRIHTNQICDIFRKFVIYTRLLEMFIIQNVVYTLHQPYSRDFVPTDGALRRKPKMRTPSFYYFGLAVFCVVSLFIVMAHL